MATGWVSAAESSLAVAIASAHSLPTKPQPWTDAWGDANWWRTAPPGSQPNPISLFVAGASRVGKSLFLNRIVYGVVTSTLTNASYQPMQVSVDDVTVSGHWDERKLNGASTAGPTAAAAAVAVATAAAGGFNDSTPFPLSPHAATVLVYAVTNRASFFALRPTIEAACALQRQQPKGGVVHFVVAGTQTDRTIDADDLATQQVSGLGAVNFDALKSILSRSEFDAFDNLDDCYRLILPRAIERLIPPVTSIVCDYLFHPHAAAWRAPASGDSTATAAANSTPPRHPSDDPDVRERIAGRVLPHSRPAQRQITLTAARQYILQWCKNSQTQATAATATLPCIGLMEVNCVNSMGAVPRDERPIERVAEFAFRLVLRYGRRFDVSIPLELEQYVVCGPAAAESDGGCTIS